MLQFIIDYSSLTFTSNIPIIQDLRFLTTTNKRGELFIEIDILSHNKTNLWKKQRSSNDNITFAVEITIFRKENRRVC